jgi:hypothetical protein
MDRSEVAGYSSTRRILFWEIGGIFFLVVVGSLLHFVYEWSGRSPIVGLFSAVNESVWEHLKLGYWSLVLFSLIEYWFIRRKVRNYLVAKAAGVLAMQGFIVAFFYSYTAIAGTEILALDILSYVAGSVLCGLLVYRILVARSFPAGARASGAALFALFGLALMLFTYLPPRLPLFRDSNTGQYGTTWGAPPGR